MRIPNPLAELAARSRQWTDRLRNVQAASHEWSEKWDAYHQRATELGRVFLAGDRPGSASSQPPVVDVGERKALHLRVVSVVASFCAAALLVGGVGALFWSLLNFCLLLIVVSKGLGLRVHLPDVFQTT